MKHNSFLKVFSELCDIAFLKKKVEIKIKHLETPWLTKVSQ